MGIMIRRPRSCCVKPGTMGAELERLINHCIPDAPNAVTQCPIILQNKVDLALYMYCEYWDFLDAVVIRLS